MRLGWDEIARRAKAFSDRHLGFARSWWMRRPKPKT